MWKFIDLLSEQNNEMQEKLSSDSRRLNTLTQMLHIISIRLKYKTTYTYIYICQSIS